MDRGVVALERERLAVEELELEAPGAREVVVRLEAAGVCASDLHVLRTGFGHPFPVLLGHEGAGVVEAVGAEVAEVREGDRVALGWRSPCGTCRWCARGDERRCRTPPMASERVRLTDGRPLFGAFRLGTFATRTVVAEAAAVRLDTGLPAEQACLLGCSVATGVGSVLHTARVWEGARVAVVGCGAVGLCVVQGAGIAGASEIHAIDLDEGKVELARSFGATHSGPGERLDFVFDVVGRPETVAQGLEMLGHAGTLVYVGLPHPGASAAVDLTRLFERRLRVLVSHGGDHWPARDFPRFAAWAAEGKLELGRMVTRTIALDEVAEAFEIMRSGDVIRSVVVL